MISWKAAKKLWRPANCTLSNTSQVAAANSPHYMFAEAASAASVWGSEAPQSARTRSSRFQVLVAVHVLTSLSVLLHSASFQLESILNSKSILEAQMSSESGASSRRCIGALPAWAAQPAAASRLFSMTTNRLRLTTRAAPTATSPCAESRQSPYSCTPAPSTLAMAWPEPVERLASGAPNPPHPAAPQVLWYHSIGCNITKTMISYGYDLLSYWYHRAISYVISYSRS